MTTRLALALLLIAAPALADEIRGSCDVRFLGSSTLHDFSGKAACRPFAAPLDRDASGRSIIPSVEIEVPVAEMNTANDSRDEQMRKMFESDRHPRIRAVARGVDTDRVREAMRKDPGGEAPLPLTLDIRGVERRIEATASRFKEERGRVSFDLEFPVSLKEFGLKPPSFLGIFRVSDRVVVKTAFSIDVRNGP